MKKSILVVFALFAITNIYSQEKEWTLQECIAYALENNISIKQSQLDLESSDIDRLDAIGNFIPSINLNATNAWNTRSYSKCNNRNSPNPNYQELFCGCFGQFIIV
ncbi:TolC family protein [Antarcticibacterium sp. 1MA-6-2]|uniref:TolC family protein n=1 Tax=Antarcticibacterium sp. 1MA-6-2 TaxID=2908210 RepID=UPI002882E990|nr:TolC family protein [Antarcticibacterium sp. 1MA-6-2]